MKESNDQNIELTILMPCLNEAETLAICIRKAIGFLEGHQVVGEVLISDNGSTDGSQSIAISEGARVHSVPEKGYGAALIGGIKAAKGKYIIMGDADDSYDFSKLEGYLENLRKGKELVMGNRFQGGIEKGAMPFLHKYLGNPVLSTIGRVFFNIKIKDFHCGLRGFNRASVQQLDLRTTGMEFASEMVVKSALFGLEIHEIPTKLAKDGRTRPPHLNTWRDGWRHLRFLLMFSPKWLFLIPGIIGLLVSTGFFVSLLSGPMNFGAVQLDIHSLTYFGFGVILSFQVVLFALFSKIYAVNQGLMPVSKGFKKWFDYFTLERGLLLGTLFFLGGLFLFFQLLSYWKNQSYGDIENFYFSFRMMIPSVVLLTLGAQIVFSSFLLSTLGIIQKVHIK